MNTELQRSILFELYNKSNGDKDRYYSASDIASSIGECTQSVSTSLVNLRKQGYVESMVICNLSQAQTYWNVSAKALEEIKECEEAQKKCDELYKEFDSLYELAFARFREYQKLKNRYGLQHTYEMPI